MRLAICAVRDAIGEAWLTPLYFQSTSQAVRSFQDAAADVKSDIGKHPDDYALFHLGFFDQRSGEIELLPQPVVLMVGANAKPSSPQLELE